MGKCSELDVLQHERELVELSDDESEDALAEYRAKTSIPAQPETPADTTHAESSKPPEDADARRQAHEASEAKRRAEWEAGQEKKRAVEQAQLDRIATMTEEDIVAFSAKPHISNLFIKSMAVHLPNPLLSHGPRIFSY